MGDKVALQVIVVSGLPIDVLNTIFFSILFIDLLLNSVDFKRFFVSLLLHTIITRVDDFHLLAKFLNGFNFDMVFTSNNLKFGKNLVLLFLQSFDFRLKL